MAIKSFIKQVFTIVIGCLTALFVLSCIVVFIFSKLDTPSIKQVESNSVLSFNMGGKMVEKMPDALLGSNKGVLNFKVVTKAIHQATKDSCIRAIYLDLSYLHAGWATLEEIREALLAFKAQGKTIFAYADAYTQKSYYLASVAEEIMLNPSGLLDFKGLAVTIDFYTKLFEHIAIKPIIFRIGPCKDAVEPFCLTKMSEESKRQTKAYLGSIYGHFLTKIASARNITVSALKAHANVLSSVLPNDALQANLITKIGYETDAKKLLKEKLKSPSFINYRHYSTSVSSSSDSGNQVAVVMAEGTIVDGASSTGYLGAHDFTQTIKEIQEDINIKAVVLRIHSPGGSVLASDIMWKAIEELKSVKPVVASLSNVAASGGYYIAAPCNYIFAQPTTLTGSIGIFGMLFDPTPLMDKIGIYRDVVKTAPSADFLAPRVSCSDVESKLIYKMLEQSYGDFLRKVSDGRRLDLALVKKLAGGRVYTGLMAQNNGLVDELGGLEAAIAKAAHLAQLTQKYSITYLPHPKTKLKQLLTYTSSNIKTELLYSLVQAYPMLHCCQMPAKPYPLQALLPYTIHID